jgi:quinol---cytochrome c reductase iron-sulfur subunit
MSERDDRNLGPHEPGDDVPATAWEAGGSVFDRLKHPRRSSGEPRDGESGAPADEAPLRQGDDSGGEVLGTPPNPTDSRTGEIDQPGRATTGSSITVGVPGPGEVDYAPHVQREQIDRRAERRAEQRVAFWFTVATIAGLAFAIMNFAGDKHKQYYTPVLGICLGVAMAGIGFGVIIWAKRLIPDELAVQEREVLRAAPEDVEKTEALVASGFQETGFARRPLLRRTLIGSLTAVGALAVVPLLNFGPFPKKSLYHTKWRKGARLVTQDGTPVKIGDLEIGGITTVFPAVQDASGKYVPMTDIQSAATSSTMLIRLRPGENIPRKGRENWAYQGHVAYSKICTHAGCPVGLYEQQTHHLLCPCHQSVFDVPDGCRRIGGPATRSLPQLPITVDADGFFVAQSDYHEPVGPGFWERGHYDV